MYELNLIKEAFRHHLLIEKDVATNDSIGKQLCWIKFSWLAVSGHSNLHGMSSNSR